MRVTAEVKLATRRRILDAAQQLFAEQGFETATTREIARSAKIAAGTLFNYFPSKESIAACLVSEAHLKATDAFLKAFSFDASSLSLEEALFAYVATGLRKMKPFRKYLPVALEASQSLSMEERDVGVPSLRTAHLETVGKIVADYGYHESFSPLAIQLYWTLYTGLLTFWAKDSDRKQDGTLALLDQSIAMFVGWLSEGRDRTASSSRNGG